MEGCERKLSESASFSRCGLEGLLDDCADRLYDRVCGRLALMQEELVERLARPSAPSAAPWLVSPKVTSEALGGQRPSLGTELLLMNKSQRRTPPPEVAKVSSKDVSAQLKGRLSIACCSQLPTRSGSERSASEVDIAEVDGPCDTVPVPRGRRTLTRLVDSRAFEVVVGAAILANAVVIGVQTDAAASRATPDGNPLAALDAAGLAFGCVFAMELALKLYCKRCGFFTEPGDRVPNLVDAGLVLAFVGEAVASAAAGDVADRSVERQSLALVRVLRIARLLRVLRVVRVFRCVRPLRTMVCQLVSTLQPLLWALVLLVMILYTFAIVFTQLVLLHRANGGETPEALLENWSTLPRSMLSLFKSITNGEDWGTTASPLVAVGPGPVALFIGFIAFAQFAMLNILTGVFCQNAIETATHDQELVSQQMLANKAKYIDNMMQLFKEFDEDRDGTVSIAEFCAHLNDDRVRAYFESLELDTTDVRTLFRLMDPGDREELLVDDFVAGCMRLKGAAKSMDILKLSLAQTAIAKRLARFIERTDLTLEAVADHVGCGGDVAI